MQNSRHERAVVMVIAYVIGFITAFIAFGLAHVVTPNTIETKISRTTVDQELSTILIVDDTGLRVSVDGEERLLTVSRASAYGAGVLTSQTGFFYQLVDAELSRDGAYVYYCEQIDNTSDVCDAYVYDVATETLHPVELDDAPFQPRSVEHTSTWSASGDLSVNFFTSRDPGTPWRLYTDTN